MQQTRVQSIRKQSVVLNITVIIHCFNNLESGAFWQNYKSVVHIRIENLAKGERQDPYYE